MTTFNCLLVFEVTDQHSRHSFLDEHLLLIQAEDLEAARHEALAYAGQESGSLYTDQNHHMEWRFLGIKRLMALSGAKSVQCLDTRENLYSEEYARGLKAAENFHLAVEHI